MRSLRKFASVHASVTNHFNSERHLLDRETFKIRRSAEEADPGMVRSTLDTLIEPGEEPTKAAVRRELMPTRSGLVTLSCELGGEMRLSQANMTQQ